MNGGSLDLRPKSVVGVFDSSVEAERALAQLRAMGAGPEDVSVMMRDSKGGEMVTTDAAGSPVAGGAATGATLGGLLGGLAGWMVSIGAIVIPGVAVPGVGTIIGGGVLASTLTGLAIGAATGGLIGALLGLGVPEEDAREYESHLKEGRILVTVHPSPAIEAAAALSVMQANGAYDVREYDAPRAPAPNGGPRPAEHAFSADHTPILAEEARVVQEPSPVSRPAQPVPDELEPDGEVAAHTDALGSGADGGYGDGNALTKTDSLEETPARATETVAEPERDSERRDTGERRT